MTHIHRGISLAAALMAVVTTAHTAGAWTMDTPLSSSDASFLGERADSYAGYSVSSAGDVDGDGFGDLVIGAAHDSQVALLAGKVYLVLGDAAGWSMDSSLTAADASFLGEAYHDQAGICVAGAGDLDGDGHADLLIGARGNGEAASNAGQIYVVFGGAGGWIADMPLGSADASFLGEDVDDTAGYSVAGVGDVDGDGFDDALLSGHLSDENGSNAGQAYLVLGRATGWSMDTSLAAADASFIGEAADDMAGVVVAGAGDVDADGHQDMLIGATYNDEVGTDAGQAYLVLGGPSGWALDTPLAAVDASFVGESAEDRAASAVASAGDADGDGYDDILVGARGNDDAGADAGKVYLLLGGPGSWAMDTSLAAADASFLGEAAGDLIGSQIAGGGDVNADGHDDFVMGTWSNDEAASQAGQVWLILGRSGSWPLDESLTAADASFLGEATIDWAGWSLSISADLNGDGGEDIVIGAPSSSEAGVEAGQTYVLFGDPDPGDDDDDTVGDDDDTVGDDDDTVGDDDDDTVGDDDDDTVGDDDDDTTGDDDDSAQSDDDDSVQTDDDDSVPGDDDAVGDDDDATAGDDDVSIGPGGDDGCECDGGGRGSGSGLMLVVGLLLGLARRRRSVPWCSTASRAGELRSSPLCGDP